MVNIEQVCKNFNTVLENRQSSQNVLDECVLTKLNNLYIKQSDDYDKLITNMERLLASDNISEMCRVVKKLSKNMGSNRNQLIYLIEELEKE